MSSTRAQALFQAWNNRAERHRWDKLVTVEEFQDAIDALPLGSADAITLIVEDRARADLQFMDDEHAKETN